MVCINRQTYDDMSRDNVFGGCAPKLRCLHLLACWVDLHSPVYRQLHRLALTQNHARGVSSTMFFRFLGECALLRWLNLSNIRFDEVGSSGNQSKDLEITLPNLETLCLSQVQDMLRLLEILEVPRCTLMQVEYLRFGALPDLMRTSQAPAAVATFKGMLGRAERVVITLSCDSDLSSRLEIWAFSRGVSTFEFAILQNQSPFQTLVRLSQDWALSELRVPITICMAWNSSQGLDAHVLERALHLLPSTTKLILREPPSLFTTHAILSLANPSTADSGIHWICPNLERLILLECKLTGQSIEKFREAMENRSGKGLELYSDGKSSEIGDVPPLPRRLKQLVLHGVGPDKSKPARQRIEQLMGPGGEVLWEPSSVAGFRNVKLLDDENNVHLERNRVWEAYSEGVEGIDL